MNILYLASEANPFVASGGLGDVAGSLPKALADNGIDCRLMIPLYSAIKSEYRDKMEYITNFYVPVSWRSQYCGLFRLNFDGVECYFLDNEFYFKRSGLYGYYDDAERFSFFSRACLEAIKYMDFKPDIIHCNDWQTALVPVFLNAQYRSIEKFSRIKTLFTIHNIQYQGQYGHDIFGDIVGLPESERHVLEYNGCVNFMKGAIVSVDRVSTVSNTYAHEILDPWFAYGLDALLRDNSYKLTGVLNGIDVKSYDPEKDLAIEENFSAKNPEGKAACKKALLREFDLPDDGEPVIGIVSRLVSHKGFDLVKQVLEYIIRAGMKVVILGSGESMYEGFFYDFSQRFRSNVGLRLDFDPKLARRIYAGSDMFLMPSKSEPCGLSQMIALRYGTIPIVREVGGLKDTITDCGDGKGNGFTFKTYNAHDMLDACMRANTLYQDKEKWDELVLRALKCDNSWKKSAIGYKELYEEIYYLW